MLTSSISLKNFRLKKSNSKIKKKIKFLLFNKSQIINLFLAIIEIVLKRKI